MQKFAKNLFFILICLAVTAAWWVDKYFLFPYVTSKAFFFRICIELAFPFFVYLLISNPKLRPSLKNPLSLSVLAFVVINFISSFTGVSVVRSLFGNFERMGGAYYIAHLAALYFYVLVLGQMEGKYLPRFLKFLLFVAFVETGNGIFGWLGLPTFVLDPSLPGRVSSTLGNPIYIGSFLIIPLYIALYFSVEAEKLWNRLLYIGLAVMFLWGIFLSGTRGAVVGIILGTFIGGVVYLIFTKDNKIRKYGLAAVVAFVILCGLLFSFSNKLPQGSTVQRIFKLQDSNSEARLLQWKIALKGYKDHPLLGTGPENYYVVANLYYNPEIFKYDPSWFDKPHNYIIEILVTNGILGLLAYLSILLFIVLSLYKAYRAELFGLLEFSILVSALLVYQIQNLFVFDTVPASLMFYSFIGFAGYLWSISNEEVLKNVTTGKKGLVFSQGLSLSGGLIALVVCAYAIYATNVVPMLISYNINYGFAYSGVDPVKADNYFNTAISLPFNFDKTETASKYGDFATSVLRSATDQNKDFAVKILDQATSYMQEAIAVQPNNPILWQRISTLYLYRNVQVGDAIVQDPRVAEAVQKALALAPNREEGYLALAQSQALRGDFTSAEQVLRKTISIFPTDSGVKVQLVTLLRIKNRIDEAVPIMESALDHGYNFGSFNDASWLVDYYVQNKNFDKAISLLIEVGKKEPGNVEIFVNLAKLYAVTGKTLEAKNLAESIMNFDSTKKVEMQALINSLSSASASGTPGKAK